MKKIYKRFIYPLSLLVTTIIMSCSTDISDEILNSAKGQPAECLIELNQLDEAGTRTVKDQYDTWSISAFNSGDKVGFYTLGGVQNPEDETIFDQTVSNQPMYYEGRIGNYYRFSNPDITIDALTVNANYSKMYHPYFPEMPSTTDKSTQRGIVLRQIDPEDDTEIEKCVDFMYSDNQKISLVNGMLQPTFKHSGGVMGIQRGEGFKNAKDKRIWVVVKDPYTDVRVYQYNYSATNYFTYSYQNIPEENEEVMISINPDKPDEKVNKYRVWQCWQGNNYNSLETYYVITPPTTVTYILMKDDYGKWQTVTDFYLYSKPYKTINANYRYMVKVEMEGLKPVVKPVLVSEWNEEIEITDNRKVGIQSIEELTSWIALYNSYIEQGRPESLVESLRRFGDAVRSGEDGPVSWTFYINDNIELQNSDNYTIQRLEDTLEGSSVYKNYSVSNLRHTLISELAPNGKIRALDFDELYVIYTDSENSANTCGGLIGQMKGGLVENCNINNGIVVTDRKVGMIAGTFESGTVKDCDLSGNAIGSQTAENFIGVFGEVNGNPVFTNNNIRELNFINFQ